MSNDLNRFQQNYRDKQIIFCEFEPGNEFFFIQSGQVKLIKINEGSENIIDVLSPGVFFGEMAVIESEPRSATAIALGDVRLLRFSRENFEGVLLQNPQLVLKLIKTFVDRIWSQRQRLRIFAYKSPSARIIACLLNLRRTSQNSRGESVTYVEFDPEEISKWVNFDVNECKSVLKNLTKNNFISLYEHTIYINDLSGLLRQLELYGHMDSNE